MPDVPPVKPDKSREEHWLSAGELHQHYRKGILSPVEMVECTFARIGEINPVLNAFCALDEERALEAARTSGERYAKGEPLGPLDGVPVAIKDLTPTAGLRTARGSVLFADHVPKADAIIVERLKRAGAIVVGKTTTSEFGNASVTESPLTGITRNPWNPMRMSGGSSGGSAVAVATGCVPLAEGSDMGGSIRIPACFCGVVGLKPALGRIPFGFLPSAFDRMTHHGPIARRVEDAASFLNATAGPDDRDPLSLPTDPAGFSSTQPDVKKLKIAYSPDLGFQSVERDVLGNAAAMITQLRARGVQVDEIDLGLETDLYTAAYRLGAALFRKYYGAYEADNRDRLDRCLLKFFEHERGLSAEDLLEVDLILTKHWRRLAEVFAQYDAILCPTMPRIAPPTGLTEFDFSGKDDRGAHIHFDMTVPFNLFGQIPAMTVPSGLGHDGMPTGIQIAGRRYEERTVFAIGRALHDPALWTERLKRLAGFKT